MGRGPPGVIKLFRAQREKNTKRRRPKATPSCASGEHDFLALLLFEIVLDLKTDWLANDIMIGICSKLNGILPESLSQRKKSSRDCQLLGLGLVARHSWSPTQSTSQLWAVRQ